jgi:type I restriction enzyme S subunit
MSSRLRLGDVAWIEARIVDPTLPAYRVLPHVSAENIMPISGELIRLRTADEDGMTSGKYLFDAGDVLYSKLRPYLRKSSVPEFGGLCSADIYPIKTDSAQLLPMYLRTLLVSREFTAYADEESARSRMPKLNREQLLSFEVQLPSIAEQQVTVRKVSAQLAEVETARRAAHERIEDLAVLGARVLSSAFSDPLSFSATLNDVLKKVETGKSFQTTERSAGANELGVLKVSAVSWSDFRPDEAKAVIIGYEPEQHHRIRAGDLIMSRANTKELVGSVVLVDRDYEWRLLSDKTLRLVIDERLASKTYLLYALRAPVARGHIERFATGTSDSMRNISQSVIRNTPLYLPHLPEQRRIAAGLKAKLAELDTARQAAQTQLREIEALPAKLLGRAFSGLA